MLDKGDYVVPPLHDAHRNRDWADFHVISHVPFACVVALAMYKQFYEIAVLITLVLATSIPYHIGFERRTMISYFDNFTAFTLSMYGNVQLFFSPSGLILGINLSLGTVGGIIFILGYTTAFAPYYDYMHPVGLHIIPAIWCTVVVLFQRPLLF